jgi:hypothetical protein
MPKRRHAAVARDHTFSVMVAVWISVAALFLGFYIFTDHHKRRAGAEKEPSTIVTHAVSHDHHARPTL